MSAIDPGTDRLLCAARSLDPDRCRS